MGSTPVVQKQQGRIAGTLIFDVNREMADCEFHTYPPFSECWIRKYSHSHWRMHGAKQAAAKRPYTGTSTFNHSNFGASLRIDATFVQIHTVRRIDAFPRAFLCFPRVIRLREASISIQSVPRGYAMSTFPNFALG
jgi:hypothetical protein